MSDNLPPPPPPPPAASISSGKQSVNHTSEETLQPPPPPPPPPGNDNVQERDSKFEERQRRWTQSQKQKFAKQRRHGFIETQKADLPPEHLRQIMRMHGDMSSKKYRHGKCLYASSRLLTVR